jgi:hypothetical protein
MVEIEVLHRFICGMHYGARIRYYGGFRSEQMDRYSISAMFPVDMRFNVPVLVDMYLQNGHFQGPLILLFLTKFSH